MNRRWLALLLVLAYAVSQMAALPHAHATQTADHADRPHVHGDWLIHLMHADAVPLPGPAHHHYHHGHRHSRSPSKPSPTPVRSNPPCHDDDSVYVPTPLLAGKEVRVTGAELGFLWATADVAVCVASLEPPSVVIGDYLAPPQMCGEHCALYLTLRTLRI